MKEKIWAKILVIVLITFLLISDFLILGQGIVLAVYEELETQNLTTNVSNVEFNAYFDNEGQKVHSKTAEIKKGEHLILDIYVKEKGVLNDAKIKIENSNFRIKPIQNTYVKNINSQTNEIELNSILYEERVILQIPVEFVKTEVVTQEYFVKENTITLTGIYKNEKEQNVEGSIKTRILWTQNTDIEMTQEIEKYIATEEGVLLQQAITTNIPENVLPREKEKISIQASKIEEYPSAVTILVDGRILETFVYNKTTGNLEFEVTDTTWSEGIRKYTVIYEYENQKEATKRDINLNTNVISKLYTIDEIKKELNMQETIETKGNIVSGKKQATNEIYKGYLYAKAENATIWEEQNIIEISQSTNVDSIEIQKAEESFINGNTKTSIKDKTYYTATTFNKADLDRIFGAEYTIYLENQNKVQIGMINQETAADDNDNITIEYNATNQIKIITPSPQNEGTFIVKNKRQLDNNLSYSKEQLKQFTELNTQTKVVSNLGEELIDATIVLQDTKTEAKMEVNTDNFSTLKTNENVQFLITLLSKDNRYDLFKNPTVKIVLPSELKMNVKNIEQLNNRNELTIAKAQTFTNENGEQVIELKLEGEQLTFVNSINEGIQIALTGDITSNIDIPSKLSEIKLLYTNENRSEEVFENIKPIKINSKYGLLIANKLYNYNQKQEIIENIDDKIKTGILDIMAEARIATQEVTLVNNYETEITDVVVIGKIPLKGEQIVNNEELEVTFETKLLEAIKIEGKETKIYYSEDENATKDSETWKESISDITKAKSFKIELEGTNLEAGTTLKITYPIEIPAELKQNEATYTDIKVEYNYVGEEKNSQSIIKLATEQKNSGTEITQVAGIAEENNEEMNISIFGKTGGKELKQEQEVYEGQGIKYVVKITNNSNETINNIVIKATQENAIFYTEKVYNDGWDSATNTENVEYTLIEENPELKERQIVIEKIEPGETVEKYYQFSVKEVEGDDKTTSGKIQITADGQEIKEYDTFTNPIKQAELKLQFVDKYELEDPLRAGGVYPFFFNVTNISDETKHDIILQFEVPEGFYFESDYLWEAEENEYEFIDYDNRILTIKVNEIEPAEMISIRASLDIDEMDVDITQKTFDFIYKGTLGENNYVSNEQTVVVYNTGSKFVIAHKGSIEGEEVKNGDKLDYIIEIDNKGPNDQDIEVDDSVPIGAVISKASAKFYEGNNLVEEEEIELEDNDIYYFTTLKDGQKLIITIETNIDTELVYESPIVNEPMINVAGQELICNTVSYKVTGIIDDLEQGGEGEGTEGKEEHYKIQGTVWQDNNRNGAKEASDDTVENVKVYLIETETGEIITTTDTDDNGIYSFEEVEIGKYFILFKYDAETYKLTEYRKSGVSEESNSDVIEKEVTLEGEQQKVAITSTLELIDQDLLNIDAGLIEKQEFDLKLEKFVEKIIVQNSKGTTVMQYDNAQLAKIDIDSKQLANSTVIIEYKIRVTNEGETSGYVNEIVDYKPSDLEFSSELNKSWYQATDGQLYSKELSNQIINPGETKNVSLTLVKTMTLENTGTIINTAEINMASNNDSSKDIDSTPGNKVSGEDDMSTAEVIISIRTGSTVLYIGLIISLIIIMGTGIYFINKKVLINDR